MKVYKRDQKVLTRLNDVITKLSQGESLPESYKNHPLRGKYEGLFDCHIFPNVVLIYGISENTVSLTRIGTHNKLELTECTSCIPSKISNTTIKSEVYYFGKQPKQPQTLHNYIKSSTGKKGRK